MIKAERQREILQLLGQGGIVSVTDLAEKLLASTLTVRRDLVELQNQGLLNRTHGGAVLDAALHAHLKYEVGTFEDRAGTYGTRKRRIAERAATLVSNGDSLLVNAGSTTTEFARALRDHQNLQIATNGLTVALELGRNPTCAAYMLPGPVEKRKMATLFDIEAPELVNLRAPSAFLGVVAVNPTDGPLMLTSQEAAMTRVLVDSASETTLLVDSSKFQSNAMYRVVPMSRIQRVITDDGICAADRQCIEAAGVELIVVPAGGTGN